MCRTVVALNDDVFDVLATEAAWAPARARHATSTCHALGSIDLSRIGSLADSAGRVARRAVARDSHRTNLGVQCHSNRSTSCGPRRREKRARRYSAPRQPPPAAATSTACDLWAVRNRPRRSASPPRPRQRYMVWPRPANACGPGRPQTLLPPVADESVRLCPCCIEGRRNLAVTPSFTSFRSRCISVICGAIDSEIVRKINDGRY